MYSVTPQPTKNLIPALSTGGEGGGLCRLFSYGRDSSILTVEFKLNLISPADGELLRGRASVLKYGKTLTVCRSDVFVVKNGVEKLCAASQSTLIELHGRSDG